MGNAPLEQEGRDTVSTLKRYLIVSMLGKIIFGISLILNHFGYI